MYGYPCIIISELGRTESFLAQILLPWLELSLRSILKSIMVNIDHGKKKSARSSLLHSPWRVRASTILGIRGHEIPPTLRIRLHSGVLAAILSWYLHSPEGKFTEQSSSLDLMHDSRY